jgi:hypothetical protein
MENDEYELNERQLEIVVGGSKNSMQMVYQNWREYLQEDEQQEFGPKFDAAIKDCDEFGNGMIGAEEKEPHYSSGCLEKKGFKMMGEGSFRNVYALPGSAGKQYVLKVGTKGDESKMMNKLEADTNMQRRFGDLVPKTYKHAEDYSWVVMERVFPWKGGNDQFIQAFFPEFADKEYIKEKTYYPTQSAWEFFKDVSEKIVENIKEGDEGKDSSLNIEFVTPEEGKGKNNSQRREMGYERRVEFEKRLSPLYKRFIDLATEYNIEFWDIVARNVGTRADDSFVILDLSVFPGSQS